MNEAPVLAVKGVRRSFGHVEALRGVDLDINKAEIHALLGDNGAGKSTLIRILAGVDQPNAGVIELHGHEVHFRNARQAQAAGIETVYQDLALAGSLTAGENIYLGREIIRPGVLGKLGFLDRARMRNEAAARLASLGAKIPSAKAEVEVMSGGQRQAVAVARAALWGTTLIMMDEPTAALGVAQTAQVLELMRRVRDEHGISVLLISHNLPDVFAVADRVTVLRMGERVLTAPIDQVTTTSLIEAMTGALKMGQPQKGEAQ